MKDTIYDTLLFIIAAAYVLITLQGSVLYQAILVTLAGAIIMVHRGFRDNEDK